MVCPAHPQDFDSDYKGFLNRIYTKACEYVPKRLILLGIFVLGGVGLYKSVFSDNSVGQKLLKNYDWSQVTFVFGNNNKVVAGNNVKPVGQVEGEMTTSSGDSVNRSENQEWKSFNANDWPYFDRFKVQGDAVTLYSEPKADNSVTTQSRENYTGNIELAIRFKPLSSQINLNLWYGNWFRWEVGSGDKRAVRLFLNSDGYGCSAMKKAKPGGTWFLPSHDEFKENEISTATMKVFSLPDGRVQTQLYLQYWSTKENKEKDTGPFDHIFESKTTCGEANSMDKILDIQTNPEYLKVGLMDSRESKNEPVVQFIDYKILSL